MQKTHEYKKDGYRQWNARQFLQSHYLATSRESRRYAVCGCRHLATVRESKAHFGWSWVRPWDYRGKCYIWIEGEFNACQTHRSMYSRCTENSKKNIPVRDCDRLLRNLRPFQVRIVTSVRSLCNCFWSSLAFPQSLANDLSFISHLKFGIIYLLKLDFPLLITPSKFG